MEDDSDQDGKKSGRVMAQRNANRIMSALRALQEALDDAGIIWKDVEEELQAKLAKGDITEEEALEMLAQIAGGKGIKAVGDWELEVRGVPFGSAALKDVDGEYFSQKTNLHTDRFPSPLVHYYHGLNPDGKPDGDPEIIGEVKGIESKADGIWYRVVLNKLSEYAKRVWEAAQKGVARASSGSIAHLTRKGPDGELLNWPVVELALFDAVGKRQPANKYAVALPAAQKSYKRAGVNLPDVSDFGEKEKGDMDEIEVKNLVEAALKADREARAADEAAKKAEQERIDAAVAAEKKKWEEEAAKSRRLHSDDGTPYIAKFNDGKFNNLDAGDQAVLVGVLTSAGKRVSETAIKSLAAKMEEDKSGVGEMGRQAMKMAGLKANEVDYSTYATFGDEWVGIGYSQALWEQIRVATFVANRLPAVEIPQGIESMYLPLESTDPVFYKVAEATAIESTLKVPQATVTNSPVQTNRVQITLAKMGGRTLWTGELEEGSLIPFVSQLRSQLVKAGAEYLESCIVDGDTETGATTNINDIGGTPAATDWHLLFNGFRKSPLVTTTANSRSAGGSLDVTDYLNTVKLMGGAGINALDRSKVGFIVDPNVYWATIVLPEILTRDVYSSPMIEGGQLKGLFGYGLDVSGQMHFASTVRKANTAGKVDQDTPANNAYGAILAVRWDQWKLGWRRRMTIETTRIANADSTEIVAMMRVGLIQRDTEASAISYYVGV